MVGDRRHRHAVGEHAQGMIEAQLGSPLREGHSQLGAEQAAERAFACPGGRTQRRQRARVGGIAMKELADRETPALLPASSYHGTLRSAVEDEA